MKPVLTVEGKQLEVYAMFYRAGKIHSVSVIDENSGVVVTYHDSKENTQYYTEKPLQVDFDKCLHFEGRYSPVFDALDSLIESQQKEVQDLATEIVDSETPFRDFDLMKKRNNLKQRTFGLMDAQDIVSEFMEDDVDLSGGEEVAEG